MGFCLVVRFCFDCSFSREMFFCLEVLFGSVLFFSDFNVGNFFLFRKVKCSKWRFFRFVYVFYGENECNCYVGFKIAVRWFVVKGWFRRVCLFYVSGEGIEWVEYGEEESIVGILTSWREVI